MAERVVVVSVQDSTACCRAVPGIYFILDMQYIDTVQVYDCCRAVFILYLIYSTETPYKYMTAVELYLFYT